MAVAVEPADMSRPRPDTMNQEPAPRTQTDETKRDEATEAEDDRIVFSAWDSPLVPPLNRR
jgi:hypothetical protein